MSGERGFGGVDRLPSKMYRARYLGPDKKRHTAPYTFPTERQARKWLDGEQDLIVDGRWTPPESRTAPVAAPTVAEYVEREVQRRLDRPDDPIRQQTAETAYLKPYRLRLKDSDLGAMLVTAVTPGDVQAWWQGLDRATPSLNWHSYELLRSVMRHAVEIDELIGRSPCRPRMIKKPDKASPGQALSVAQALDYLDAINARYRVQVMCGLFCDLRSGEMRGLRWCDVDLKGGWLHVRRQAIKQGGTLVLGPLKTDASERDVLMPDEMLVVMRAWLGVDETEPDDERLVFPAVYGNGKALMNDTSLNRVHKTAAAKIGRPDLTLHDLRRTAATTAFDGAAAEGVKAFMGHTTTTQSRAYDRPGEARERIRVGYLNDAIAEARRLRAIKNLLQ